MSAVGVPQGQSFGRQGRERGFRANTRCKGSEANKAVSASWLEQSRRGGAQG